MQPYNSTDTARKFHESNDKDKPPNLATNTLLLFRTVIISILVFRGLNNLPSSFRYLPKVDLQYFSPLINNQQTNRLFLSVPVEIFHSGAHNRKEETLVSFESDALSGKGGNSGRPRWAHVSYRFYPVQVVFGYWSCLMK